MMAIILTEGALKLKSGRAGVEPTVYSYYQHSYSRNFVIVLRPYTPVPTINKAVIIPISLFPFHDILNLPCRFPFLFRESVYAGRSYEILKQDKNAPRARATIG